MHAGKRGSGKTSHSVNPEPPTPYMHQILPSKHLRVLEIRRLKTGVGAYTRNHLYTYNLQTV